jgi:hypothetical protein
MAWRYAKIILDKFDMYKPIKTAFQKFRKQALDGYYAAHKRAVLKGKDAPDYKEFKKKIKEVRSGNFGTNQG